MSHGGPGAPLVSTASASCGIVEVLVVLVVLVVPVELVVGLDLRFVLLPHHLTVSPLLTKTRILTFTQNHLYRHLWRSK